MAQVLGARRRDHLQVFRRLVFKIDRSVYGERLSVADLSARPDDCSAVSADFSQLAVGNVGGNQISQRRAVADRRKLIRVADEQNMRAFGTSRE